MSDYIDTRDGWREVDTIPSEEAPSTHMLWEFKDGESVRAWVREEPAPPLPTEPYTVIRVSWREGLGHGADPIRHLDGDWEGLDEVDLARRITSFEVLSEPRAVTANAVLDRVRGCLDEDSVLWESEVDAIAREFGVES